MSELERADEMAPPMPAVPPVRGGLGATLVRGAAWTAAANVMASALSAAVGLALARLLTPADFGIQAAVVTITVFFGTVLDLSLGSAIVQREELDHAHLSSLFWLGLAGSGVLYLAVAAAGPLVAVLFNAPEVRRALPVAALSIVLLGAAIVPAALLRRRLAFSSIARAQAAGAVVASGVAVAIALAGGHYWALIGYGLASVCVSSALVLRAARFAPRGRVRLAHLAPVRGYAGAMMSFLAVNYWSRNMDDVIIGRALGVGSLGIFNFAQRLVGAPLQLLTGSIAPLLHPTFAAMGDDVRRQRGAYLDLAHVTALATFPVSAALFVLAEPIVLVVGGERWRGSAAVMRALCLLSAVQPVNMLCGAVFMSRDAAHLMLRYATIGAVAVVTGMLVGLHWGVAGVAWGYAIAYATISAPTSTLNALGLLGGGRRALARALTLPLAIGVAMLGVALALGVVVPMLVPPSVARAATLVVTGLALAAALLPAARRVFAARRRRRAP